MNFGFHPNLTPAAFDASSNAFQRVEPGRRLSADDIQVGQTPVSNVQLPTNLHPTQLGVDQLCYSCTPHYLINYFQHSLQYPTGIASFEYRSEMSVNSETSGDIVLPYNDAAQRMVDPIIQQEGLNLIDNEMRSIQANADYQGTVLRDREMLNQNKLCRLRLGSM